MIKSRYKLKSACVLVFLELFRPFKSKTDFIKHLNHFQIKKLNQIIEVINENV